VGRSSPRRAALASSTAKNGFPPDCSWISISCFRVGRSPSASATMFEMSSTPSGPIVIVSDDPALTARSTPGGRETSSDVRTAIKSRMGRSRSRLNANPRTRSLLGSIHWASSIEMNRPCRSDAIVNSVWTAADTARTSVPTTGSVSSSSATAIALR
jgi:hypothetical protein